MSGFFDKQKIIIIMAGGEGKRMDSTLPKVLHQVDSMPMIVKIIHEALLINPRKIFIVVGKHRYIIEDVIKKNIDSDKIEFIDQYTPKGTGHAIMSCKKKINRYNFSNVLILSGDVPCITHNTMMKMFKDMKVCRIAVFNTDCPAGYGRIITKNNNFVKIVEHKDATYEQLKIMLVNSGLYCFDTPTLCKYLPFLKNNNSQGEYYITDLPEIIIRNEKEPVDMYLIPDTKRIEVKGVNTQKELKEVNNYLETLKLAYEF